MPGKTPMWGNPMRERERERERERDLLFSFRKLHINNSKYHFQQEKSTYSTLKQPPNIFPQKTFQVRIVVQPVQKTTL
jgi:hypothetical protein